MYSSVDVLPLSLADRTPTDFILNKLLPIPRGTVAMISSEGGLGKTYLSIRLAADYVIEAKDKRALVWFSEDGQNIIASRFDNMVRHRMVNKEAQEKIDYVNTEARQFAKLEKGVFKADYDAFVALRKDCILNGVGLVIIDPLLAFYGGDENNNSQARVFMQPFLEWAKQDGVTIIFIHHSNKNEGRTRGAGAFRDAVRTLYELRYIKSGENIDFEKKDAGLRDVALVKDNLGAFYHFNKLYGSGCAEMKIIPAFDELLANPDLRI